MGVLYGCSLWASYTGGVCGCPIWVEFVGVLYRWSLWAKLISPGGISTSIDNGYQTRRVSANFSVQLKVVEFAEKITAEAVEHQCKRN